MAALSLDTLEMLIDDDELKRQAADTWSKIFRMREKVLFVHVDSLNIGIVRSPEDCVR
jgi:hypothetical protein